MTRKDNLKRHVSKAHGITFSPRKAEKKSDSATSYPTLPSWLCQCQSMTQSPARLLLMQAAAFGNLPLLEAALRAGATSDTISDDGSTALHCAARAGQLSIVEYLFHIGADTNLLNKKNRTPFQEGILGGDVSTMIYMLKNNMSAMDTKMRFLSTFKTAMLEGNEDILKTFTDHLEHEVICEEQGLNMLREAIKHSHVNLVHWLLSSVNVKVNSLYKTGDVPIRHATKVGHIDVMEVLMASNDLDPNVRCGYNIDAPLHVAVEKGFRDAVELLLKDGRVNVNVESQRGSTSLHLAVKQDKIDIARLILAHPKVDVNIVNRYGDTPLFEAIGRLEVLENPTLDNSATTIHATNISEGLETEPAITGNRLIMVQILCQAPEINLTVKDKSGNTPLQLAVYRTCWPIVQCLLRYAGAKKLWGASSEIRLPLFRVSDLPKLLKELIWHEDFQSANGFKNLLFSAALYRVSEVVGLMSQTQVFENVVMGDDTAAALLCAVCTASHDTKALEYILQQPNTNVNCQADPGMTALQVAVAIRSTEAVAVLLEHRQIDIDINLGFVSRLQHQDEWKGNGWYPQLKTARQLASFQYGPQSDIENLFAAHERSKEFTIAFLPEQVNQVDLLDISTFSHPS